MSITSPAITPPLHLDHPSGEHSGGGLTTLYTDPFQALNSNNPPGGGPSRGTAVVLGGLALNAETGELYFAQDAEDYQTGDTSPPTLASTR